MANIRYDNKNQVIGRSEKSISNERSTIHYDNNKNIIGKSENAIINRNHINHYSNNDPLFSKSTGTSERSIDGRTVFHYDNKGRASGKSERTILGDAWLHYDKDGKYTGKTESKYGEWRDRMGEHISRWKNNISKAKAVIEKIESNNGNLEDMVSNARTEEFADKVQGWLNENNNKINDIERSISEWEGKIDSVQDRLNS